MPQQTSQMGNSKILKASQHSNLWLELGVLRSVFVLGLNSLQLIWCIDLISQAEMYLPGKGAVEDVSRRKGMFANEDEFLWWNESQEWVMFMESDPKHSLLQDSIPQIRANNDSALHCWILSFCKRIPRGRKEAKQRICSHRLAH